MPDWKFRHLFRGDVGYEAARCAAAWNGCVPDRYPSLITYPEEESHVIEIVRYAKNNSLSITTKSGGHSFSVSFLRDGAILVDLAKMNNFTFDADTRIAEVQPAAYGSDLNAALGKSGLIFPGGHCPTVGLGGFLLQGGFGWNSRKWGLACESVLAIDVVTADGELLHADARQYRDFFWAARGSGCGFFGLVTKFYLRVYELPRGIMTARYVFEVDDMDEVLTAIDGISKEVVPELEICLFAARDQDGFKGRPTIAVTADALTDTVAEARSALDIVHHLPVIGQKCIKAVPYVSCTLPELLKRYDDILDNRGLRYRVDNMWTDSPVQELLPSFHRIIDSLPPPPTHLYMMWWLPGAKARDANMVFSMEARLYVAIYAINQAAQDDQKYTDYVVRSIGFMKEHRKGIQLADENLPADPGKFMGGPEFRLLEKLRARHDPDGRFRSYIRLPPEFEACRASI